MKIFFDHEKLQAYQKALEFAAWCEKILERVPKTAVVHGQLDRARTSMVLNIAEGNGKFSVADRCKYLDIAHGSSLESAGCLDLLFIKQLLSEAEIDEGKTILVSVVSLLVGLIRSKAPDRFGEDVVDYGVGERVAERKEGEGEREGVGEGEGVIERKFKRTI